MWQQHQILTIRKVFMLICMVLVALPLALFYAWPHHNDDSYQHSAVAVLAIGLVLAMTAALRLGLVFVQPIREMISVVRRIQSGETTARIAIAGRGIPSEIRALQEAFNDMADHTAQARDSENAARKAAESESRAKTDFLRFVTHELRSPTNAIIGFGELLASERHGPLGAPSYREHVRDIVSGSRHLLSLINDLLDLSKIESGQYTLALEPIGIDELMDRCRRYLQPCLIARTMTMGCTYDGAVPTVLVDERAMFQVLLNLATNAVRYGFDGGHVELSASVLADGSAEILVVDDGPGIAATDLLRVMEPFQRVENPDNRHIHGTGLGLPIVKRLVELHMGTFELDSDAGKGTRARIVLPPSRVVPDTVALPMTGLPARASAAAVSVAA